MGIKFFDVSHHQKGMDFSGAKAAGYDGVIIRAAYGTKPDECFDGFYKQAAKCGLKIGAYIYTLATTKTEVEKECTVLDKLFADKDFDLPLFWDKEEKWGTRAENTNLFLQFHSRMGLEPDDVGLYSSMYGFNTYFQSDKISADIPLWIARYNTIAPAVGRDIFAWQYTSSAIATDFYTKPLDRSIVLDNTMYENMTTAKPEEQNYVPTMEDLLIGIMDGRYGTEERRKMLLGEKIQDLVNLYYRIAIDTIAGKYGTGLEPLNEYKRLGLDPYVVQDFVSRIANQK